MQSIYYFSCVIAAASLGFLVQNLSRSKIFMGDVGSAFLGFTFAALPLLGRELAVKSPDLLPIAAVLFVWFFIFDSVMTILRRLVRGEKIWVAHREHLFQRLVSSGFTHRQVTIIYGILATILCVTVLLSVQFREEIGFAIAPVVLMLTGILLFVCLRRRVLS
jgi:UDP-N-acetylmuramyl pentapeptide phosphotransferase/UDP-N-acetylglucosamine-1-phosphate transferase